LLDSLPPSQTSEPATLDAVEVAGKKFDEAYTVQATTIGSKLPAALKDIPHSISVITRQRIEEQNLTSLDEVMAQTPGVTVGMMGTGVIPSFSSRGYTIEYFQYDGVPIQTGGASWSQPDMLMFERVEMLRGAAGLFNGAGQPGGVINLVRKRPGRMSRFSGTLGLGSWNARRLELDYGTPLNQNGSIRARVAAAHDERDSFVEIVHSERTTAYAIMEIEIAPESTFSFGGGYQKRDWLPHLFGLPRYSDGRDLKLPRHTFLSTPWTFWDFETTQGFADVKHAFNHDWQLALSAVFDHETNTLKHGHTRGAVDPATLTGPVLSGGANAYDNRQWALDAALTGAFSAFGQRHEVVIGGNWYDREAESRNGQLPGFGGTPVNVFAPDPSVIADPGAPVWTSRARTDTRQSGVYGALRLRVAAPLTVLAGGRLSWWQTRSHNLFTRTITADHGTTRKFIPYAGLVYALDPRWSAYASYAEIFRVQRNLLDSSGNGLPPVSGANHELGIKGALHNDRLNLAFALFRIEETDRAVAISETIVGNCCYATNGEVRSQGVDLELSGQVQPSVQIGAGYTFNRAKYLRDPDYQGQAFRSHVPKHLFRLWMSWQLPGQWDAWSLGGGINAQSRTSTESGAPPVRMHQGSYVIANLRFGYALSPNWSLAFNLNNLFDRHYYSRLGGAPSNGNVYGEPRNVMFSVRARY